MTQPTPMAQATFFLRSDLTLGLSIDDLSLELELAPTEALLIADALLDAAHGIAGAGPVPEPRPLTFSNTASVLVRPDLSVLVLAGEAVAEVSLDTDGALGLADHLIATAAKRHYADHPNDPRPMVEVGPDGRPEIALRHPN